MTSNRESQQPDARDLGERERLAKALAASEERFRTLVQLSFDVYWETDAEHRFTRQDFAPTLLNAPIPNSEIGRARWEVPYLEPDEEAWRRHRATLDAHLPFRDFELARPTASGGTRHVSVSGFPVFDEGGRFLGYRGVGRDITQIKHAEAQHRAHLWFLQSMDRISRAMQGTHDLDRMMRDVLDATLETFACDRAWLLHARDAQLTTWRADMERTRPPLPVVLAPGMDLEGDADLSTASTAAQALGAPGPVLPAPLADRYGIRSHLAMVLQPKEDHPYLLCLHHCSRAHRWSDDEQRLFREIGGRMADALSSLLAIRNLHDSERRLEAAQRIAHVGWWERDYSTGRVSLSDEASRIFGVEPVDMPQWHGRWLGLIHPDDRARAAAASEAALRGGPRYDVEYRVVRPDGTLRVVHSQGDVTRDDSGHPIRQFGVMQDITELRQAEAELRESEARFRKLSDLSADWYWKQDENLRFTHAADERAGYPAAVSLGKTRWELPVTPLSGTWDEHRAVLAARQPFRDFQYSLIDRKGETRYISVSGVPVFDERGAFKGYDGAASDITPRKRAEEALRASEARFRTFVDRATDAFFLMDERLRVVDVNRQACDSLGWSREELIGMHPREFDVALDEASIERLAQRAAAGEVITFETRHRRKDGTTFPVEIRTGTFQQAGKLFSLALARDITERKLAEESLRQSEAYLTEAQRLSHTGSWALDVATNRYIYTSEEFDRLFGFDRQGEAPTREAVLERMHPEDRISWMQILDRSVAEKLDTTSQYRIVLPDGRVRHIHTIRHPVIDSTGKVVRLVGTSIDITDRKRVEEEMRASEARFRTFVDRATDAFFLLDEQLTVVDVNRQACESLGFSREELIGMHPRDFDAALDEQSIALLAQRADAGGIITFETRHRRKDGTAFPVEIRTGTFRQGGALFYLALARDISERKQAEERQAKLAAIVESSDDAIISKDLNGIITTWNAGAERIFGYAAREVIGQSVMILVPPDRGDEVRGIMERIRRGERVHHFETVRRRKDGALLDISLAVSPIIDGSGIVVGASKVARDITERKLAQERLRQQDHALQTARAQLEHVARLTTLGELTSSIAHEVSQPLGGMITSAGACARWLAAEPPDIAEARSALNNITADGKRAREVIARIRALAKRQTERKESVDINQELLEVLALTEHESRSHGIVRRTELDRTLPRVPSDRIQLQQVLLNLLVNAIEAMSAVGDRPRLLTMVSRHESPNVVLVEVRDTGCGIDPQRIEQMFEAFYTTKADGIGIGLSISRSIVEAHGGRLWASPNEPHGAVFRLTLPVAAEGPP